MQRDPTKDQVINLFGKYWDLAYEEAITGNCKSDEADLLLSELQNLLGTSYKPKGWVFSQEERPKDNQLIVYWFEPFGRAYIGMYDAKDDMVLRADGFGVTTFYPEVPYWMPASEAE